MHAAQHRNRSTIIDRLDDLRRKFQPEVCLRLSDLNRVFARRPSIDIADIGESLSAQQPLREALRGETDGPGNLYQAHSGIFGGPLCGHLRNAQEAGCAGQCNAARELASGLNDRHWKTSSFLRRSRLKFALELVQKA